MTRQISHYVGGRLVQGGGGRSATVYNPATGELSAQVALASAQQVRDAVLNAKPQPLDGLPLRRARILNSFLHALPGARRGEEHMIDAYLDQAVGGDGPGLRLGRRTLHGDLGRRASATRRPMRLWRSSNRRCERSR
jgi:hypothetical protein